MNYYDLRLTETNDTIALLNALSDTCNAVHASCRIEYDELCIYVHVTDHTDSDVIASICEELMESDKK